MARRTRPTESHRAWLDEVRTELADSYGEDFADGALRYIEEECGWFGDPSDEETRAFYRLIAESRVLASSRHGAKAVVDG